MKIDMHMHTKNSDGKLSLEGVIRKITDAKLDLAVITDHDTIKNLSKESAEVNCTLLTGIELTTNYKRTHILGYGIENIEKVNSEAIKYRDASEDVVRNFVNKLIKDGYMITMEHAIRQSKNERLTVNAVCRALLDNDEISSFKEGHFLFNEKYNLSLPRISKEDAIRLIKENGGIAILAHPFYSKYGDAQNVIREIKMLMEIGIDGIEALYLRHTDEQKRFLSKFARKNNLYVTGGTDFHGYPPKDVLGLEIKEPLKIFEKIIK